MKKLLLLTLCLMVKSLSMQAQTISGKLIDEYKQPIGFANIVVLSLPDSAFVAGTISDEQGAFSISGSGDNRLLKVSCLGYAPVIKS